MISPESLALYMSSPTSASARPSPPAGGGRIGRPPQWTVSRSRKLARLYVYTTLSIEKIIKVLEDDVFKPRKNSAQKTIHNMLDNDPRYLRPESRVEMDQRIGSLSASVKRRRKRRRDPPQCLQVFPDIKEDSTSDSGPHDLDSSLGDADSIDRIKLDRYPTPAFTSSEAGSTRLGKLPPPARSVPPTSASVQRRQSTVLSSSTEPSSQSLRELKKRVSDCSTQYARQISHLLKHFTISSASDLIQSPPFLDSRPSVSEARDYFTADDPEVFEAFPEPGYALPGDFIKAQSFNCAGFPGQDHFGGKCWCSIGDVVTAERDSWLLPDGRLSPRAEIVLADPSVANLASRDCFGNTPLHLFAALDGYREALLGMLGASHTVTATNRAGQSFLHLLDVDWFTDALDPSAPLRQLLAYIRDHCPDLAYVKDVYGRTFFHRAHSLIKDSEIMDSICSPWNPALVSCRDAFGFNPLAHSVLGGEGPFIPPRRLGTLTPLAEESPGSSRERSPRTSNDEDAFLAFHARLVQIIHSSYNNPRLEDADGRNGLHCLAEAILNQQAMDVHRSAMSTRRPLKRKYDKRDTPEGAESVLAARLRHLQDLISSEQPVDVNHYDKLGNTVLMAFIIHISDDQDDKTKTLGPILERLIRAGARIEARNRRGETALLIAARLGRKIALTTLLEHGANVHARDVDGRGVLEIIDICARSTRDDLPLYARLEACRVLLTGRRDWGVVQSPSILDEWQTTPDI